MANLITGESLYEHSLISHDGKPVVGSVGVITDVDCGIRNAINVDILFVVGASPVVHTGNENIIVWLRQQKQKQNGARWYRYRFLLAGLCRSAGRLPGHHPRVRL